MKAGLLFTKLMHAPGGTRVSWSLTTSGRFTSKSMWKELLMEYIRAIPINWNKIWSLKGPSNPSFTMWLLMRSKLLTMEQFRHRKIVASSLCVLGGIHEESQLHALRDCRYPKEVWQLLLHEVGLQNVFWSCMSVTH